MPFGMSDFDLFRLLFSILNGLRKLKGKIEASVMEMIEKSKYNTIMDMLGTISRFANAAKTNSAEVLKEIKTTITDSIEHLQSALEECCDVHSDKLDSISRKIDNLDPERQANQDLAILSQGKSIQNELFQIRGLL